MLTAEQIEAQDYSINDVADLMMRLQLAANALCYVADEISRSGITDDFIKDAHNVALNTWGRIQSEHNKQFCHVSPDSKGVYTCACGLIASAEDAAKSMINQDEKR